MDLVTALSLSIGILGGIATWLFFQFGQGPELGLGLQIWGAFVGWASFYHCGGGGKGFWSSVVANIWGVVMAWLTLLAITQTGLADTIGLPVWAGICVAIGVGILVFGAKIPALSSIPAGVYGYAAAVALSTLGKDGLANLTQPTLANPAIIVALSLIIGNILGIISQQVAGTMAKA